MITGVIDLTRNYAIDQKGEKQMKTEMKRLKLRFAKFMYNALK